MSIQVVADGADGYRLLSADDEVVGWVRGRAVGVSGFESEEAVTSAAIHAYGVLAAWLERQHLHGLAELGEDRAQFVHDRAHRWIVIGRIPVARLQTGTPYDPDARTRSFEIVLKGSISEGMAIHAALVALRAAHGRIDAADIAWADRDKNLGARDSIAPRTHLQLEAM